MQDNLSKAAEYESMARESDAQGHSDEARRLRNLASYHRDQDKKDDKHGS